MTVQNKGGSAATGVQVCAKAPKRLATGSCKGTDSLLPGKRFRTSLKVTATDRPRHFVKVAYKVTADNAKPRQDQGEDPDQALRTSTAKRRQAVSASRAVAAVSREAGPCR